MLGDTATTRTAIAAAEDHSGLTVLPGVLGFPHCKTHTAQTDLGRTLRAGGLERRAPRQPVRCYPSQGR